MDPRLKAHAYTLLVQARPMLAQGVSVLEIEQLILAGHNAMMNLGWSTIHNLLEEEGTP